MTQFPRFVAVCTTVAILVAGTLALAQAQNKAPAEPRRIVVRQAQGAGGQVWPGAYRMGTPYVPGYYQLGAPHIQKELELLPEQLEKIKEIGKKYQEQMRADRGVWKDWQKMTPEERKTKSAEVREKYKKRAEGVKAQMEKVLLPHQIKLLKEISFRTRAPYSLQNPRTLEQIGVDDEQKEKLKKIRETLAEKYREMQKKALEDAPKVLTPEQKEKLEKQIQTRGY